MVVVPVCLNVRCCSSGYLGIVLPRIKAMSLPFLAFGRIVVNAIFQEYSKEGKLSPSHIGIRNIPSDICYDDTKHC